MGAMVALVAVLALSAVTILGALYARGTKRPDMLIAIYVLYTALSQILAAKIADFSWLGIQVTAPAAMILFPITFLLTDIVNERFGRKEVHRMIGIALIAQIALAGAVYASTLLPPAPFWQNQDAWRSIFGFVPRIILASWITFVVSENLDAVLFAALRKATGGRHLWMRNVFSSVPALAVDTLLFVTLAFYGTPVPLAPLMIGQFVMKYAVVVLNVPFMYMSRAIMGRSDEQPQNA